MHDHQKAHGRTEADQELQQSPRGRILLCRLQRGELLGMPHSRPMTVIGKRCHELRIADDDSSWRILYHIAPDAIVILEVFPKKTQATPKRVIDDSKRRLARYRAILEKE